MESPVVYIHRADLPFFFPRESLGLSGSNHRDGNRNGDGDGLERGRYPTAPPSERWD